MIYLLGLYLVLVLACMANSSTPIHVKQDLDELKRVAAFAAGVYRHPVTSMSTDDLKALEKTIVVTAANHAYINHIHNFKCWMDRIDMKALVFSMDKDMHTYMMTGFNTNNTNPTLYSFLWNHGEGPVIKGTDMRWTSEVYISIPSASYLIWNSI